MKQQTTLVKPDQHGDAIGPIDYNDKRDDACIALVAAGAVFFGVAAIINMVISNPVKSIFLVIAAIAVVLAVAYLFRNRVTIMAYFAKTPAGLRTFINWVSVLAFVWVGFRFACAAIGA